MITFEGPQCMWTNPSKKSRQGSDPPPSRQCLYFGKEWAGNPSLTPGYTDCIIPAIKSVLQHQGETCSSLHCTYSFTPPLSAPLTNPLSNIYSDGSASTLHYPDCDKFAIFTTYIQCSHFLCDDLAYIVFELHCQCQLEGVGWV